jgi:3-deoxy-D-manno-octulosonic acid (KDO) 8-phosphate synthase
MARSHLWAAGRKAALFIVPRRKFSTFLTNVINGVFMNTHPNPEAKSDKKRKVVYADPTKKRLVVKLERDRSLCVLLHPQDLGIELRVKKIK